MATTELSKSSWIMAVSKATVSPELMVELIDHAPVDLLERIAESTATPVDILETLACWNNPTVRAAVAENSSCPESLLARLAIDHSADVRYRLAESHHIPIEILEFMLEDDNCYVASRAKKTLDRLRPASAKPVTTLKTRRNFGSEKLAI